MQQVPVSVEPLPLHSPFLTNIPRPQASIPQALIYCLQSPCNPCNPWLNLISTQGDRTMQLRKRCLAAMPLLLVVGVAAPAQSPLKSPMTGKVDCKSIQAIAFGPQGLLLIGDGKGRQLIAVDTGDK